MFLLQIGFSAIAALLRLPRRLLLGLVLFILGLVLLELVHRMPKNVPRRANVTRPMVTRASVASREAP